jgi:hypothetical protein
MIGLVIGGAEDFLRLWRERSHALAAARPSALIKETALPAIRSKEVGTSPELLDTPALSNRITSRSRARPSVTAGSQ